MEGKRATSSAVKIFLFGIIVIKIKDQGEI
jgi:hypothetical protein